MTKIAKKTFVSVTYDLYVGEKGEELMEQATLENPLSFYFGEGMMLPKFEEQLAGKSEGDTFEFDINHVDAYGEYDDSYIVDLDKNIFMVDGVFDDNFVAPGKVVPLMGADGQRINASVVEVLEDKVKVDFNHPLAGEDLHFVGKIIAVREVSDEELEKLYAPSSCGSCSGSCGKCNSCSDCQ